MKTAVIVMHAQLKAKRSQVPLLRVAQEQYNAVKQIMVLGIRTISFLIKAHKITRRDLVRTVMDGTFKRF